MNMEPIGHLIDHDPNTKLLPGGIRNGAEVFEIGDNVQDSFGNPMAGCFSYLLLRGRFLHPEELPKGARVSFLPKGSDVIESVSLVATHGKFRSPETLNRFAELVQIMAPYPRS